MAESTGTKSAPSQAKAAFKDKAKPMEVRNTNIVAAKGIMIIIIIIYSFITQFSYMAKAFLFCHLVIP